MKTQHIVCCCNCYLPVIDWLSSTLLGLLWHGFRVSGNSVWGLRAFCSFCCLVIELCTRNCGVKCKPGVSLDFLPGVADLPEGNEPAPMNLLDESNLTCGIPEATFSACPVLRGQPPYPCARPFSSALRNGKQVPVDCCIEPYIAFWVAANVLFLESKFFCREVCWPLITLPWSLVHWE